MPVWSGIPIWVVVVLLALGTAWAAFPSNDDEG
jgi:hypothetical protein